MPKSFISARVSAFCVLMAISVATSGMLQAQSPSPAPWPSQTAADYNLRWGVKIPMRDQVELNATLYLPKTGDGSQPKTPVIFTLTPYISDTYHARGAYFASHGYTFALVDVRGRGNSGGEFEPFANEPRDGHDVVEWLAKQPFCDGKVAMWWVLRGVRSMGVGERIPATSCDDRSGGSCSPGAGLSFL